MRQLLSILLVVFAVTSCKKEDPTIKGVAPGVLNGMRVYLQQFNEQGSLIPMDTAIVMNEQFDFGISNPSTFNERLVLSIDGLQDNLIFLGEDQSINLEINKDSVINSLVYGGEQNDYFDTYRSLRIEQGLGFKKYRENQKQFLREKNKAKYDSLKLDWQEQQLAINESLEDLASANKERPFYPAIISYLYSINHIDAVRARAMYNAMDDQWKSLTVSKFLDNTLVKVEITAIGAPAPYFEGKNPQGEVIKLPEVLGKVTLVDFWASWCQPCRVENPNVVEAYQKYHDKGFNIISVSLDRPGDEAAWQNAIEEDRMTWNHISRLKYWNDPIARSYNVTSIPATFLLDDQGIIIDKNLRGKALHDRLEKLLP